MKTKLSAPRCDFVIVDVETTGLSHRYGDRMIEVAGLKVSIPLIRTPDTQAWALDLCAIQKGATFSSLLKVEREVSAGAFFVNGITPRMLETAPRAAAVLPEFLDFMQDACVIGHNVRFDLNFLAHEYSLLGLELAEKRFVDTVRLARRLLPELSRYSLANVAYSLGIDQRQEHRALSDVEMTYQVFRALLKIADRRDYCTFENIYSLSGGCFV